MFEKKNYKKGQKVTYQKKIYTCDGYEWTVCSSKVVCIYGNTMLMDNGDSFLINRSILLGLGYSCFRPFCILF